MLDAWQEPPILLETPDYLVAGKPPGMETVSQDGGRELTSLLRQQRAEPGLRPVHRLDRDTSGAQLFAKTPEAEAELTRLFRERLVGKTYLALCLGVPRNRTGVVNRRLSEWDGGRRPVRVVKKGGLEAATAYEVLTGADLPAEGLRISLVAFKPHQGRTHQIRVHAAAVGYPILGDDQYGDRTANKLVRDMLAIRRQMLHSRRLSFPWNGKTAGAVCPLAPDMAAAAEKAFGPLDALLHAR